MIAPKTLPCYASKTSFCLSLLMDSLHIQGLTVAARIGVYDWEQRICQPLLIDITIPADFTHCEDNLANTIDYAKLCQQVTNYVETNSFHLIETVADQIARLIKNEYNLPQLTISISKPQAIKNARDIRVTVTR
ncbi:dihydroneopterin aldolase [Legionella donaldsonii]|uniref:7,8-dihydroneopterin aldolase n=2 Tax=Legionellaceae TaxID=444 RepID=A0A378J2R7_9GAMM|nr:dihydroneopterin aldolase [Legionella donaldsonii]